MKKGDIVRPLKAFWYFWFDVVQSYLFGRLIRPCGRKVSWVAGGKLIKGELSVCGTWEGRRCWYVRFGKDGSDVDRMYIDERGITWAHAWTGKESRCPPRHTGPHVILLLIFLCGAIYESACVGFVHFSERGQPLRTALCVVDIATKAAAVAKVVTVTDPHSHHRGSGRPKIILG